MLYWRNISSRAARRYPAFGWRKAVGALVLTAVARGLLVVAGDNAWRSAFDYVWALAAAYVFLWFMGFLWAMVRIPIEMDQQKDAANRNLKSEVDTLVAKANEDRPHFERSKITRIQLDGDHQRPDWIRLFVFVALRNLGADSAVHDWMLTLKGAGLNSSFTDKTLSPRSDLNLEQHLGPNLLYDKTIVPKRGAQSGWLLLEKPKLELRLIGGMESALTVSVLFQDADGNQYEIGWPP